jgi:predicted nucleic acid-binding protein
LILVDSNVFLDITNNDPRWYGWSLVQLEAAVASDAVAINDVVYAELAPGYSDTGKLDSALSKARIAHIGIPKPALFLAGHAHRRYRRQRGTKSGVLADFFIGAHAFVAGATLLTRDPDRVRVYFPSVTLVTP